MVLSHALTTYTIWKSARGHQVSYILAKGIINHQKQYPNITPISTITGPALLISLTHFTLTYYYIGALQNLL